MNSQQALNATLVMSNPEVQKIVQAISGSWIKTPLYLSEVILALALLFFRLHKIKKIETLHERVIFQVWTLVLYLLLAGYVVPRLWIGPEYNRLIVLVRPLFW